MESILVIDEITVTPFQQNCRILSIVGSDDAVVIDPGGEAERILELLEDKGLQAKAIWLTHSHLDHCGGVKALKEETNAVLYGHAWEKEHRARVEDIKKMYGITDEDMENCPEPDVFLRGGETLTFGPLTFEVLFTPGHSPGHLCFYERSQGVLIAGDTLFSGSIGRTDLPGGNHGMLLESIREKILSLPDNTRVLPGHGPETTVGRERRTNLFLAEA